MSLRKIVTLLAEADRLDRAGAPAKEWRRVIADADAVALSTAPVVVHPTFGVGTVSGVGPDGRLDIAFGETPFVTEVPAAEVRCAG